MAAERNLFDVSVFSRDFHLESSFEEVRILVAAEGSCTLKGNGITVELGKSDYLLINIFEEADILVPEGSFAALVSLSYEELLAFAGNKKCAVGAFNTPTLECMNAVIGAAEKLGVPVIISHAQLHEDVSPLAVIGPVMVQAARTSKVPVCVHLDHCEDLDYMRQALEIGFTGAMYDGSTLPYAENLENTKKAVALAKK